LKKPSKFNIKLPLSTLLTVTAPIRILLFEARLDLWPFNLLILGHKWRYNRTQ